MLKKLKQRNQGFTIIEVLIVLAIAALILLIVFLAVPALQRNSRNTQRQNDAAAILGGVANFANNNNGAMPNGAWTSANGVVTIVGAANTNSVEVRVGYYNEGIGTANGQITRLAAGTGTGANTLNSNTEDHLRIATGTECQVGTAGEPSTTGPTRGITAVFEIENGANSYVQQCESS